MSRQASPVQESARAAGPAAVADAMFTVSASAERPGIGWVWATGKLTGTTAATRLAAVLQHQRATGCRLVCLDLSELSMLDRAGFDMLVDAHHQYLGAGGALVLTGVGPRVARLLQLTGLDRTLFAIARPDDVPPAGVAPAVVDRALSVVMARAHRDVSEATEQLTTTPPGAPSTDLVEEGSP
jgi:anti-anti-sigma factor